MELANGSILNTRIYIIYSHLSYLTTKQNKTKFMKKFKMTMQMNEEIITEPSTIDHEIKTSFQILETMNTKK